MAEKFISIEIENEDAIQAKLRAYEERQQLHVRRLLDSLADEGTGMLRRNVPAWTTLMRRHVGRSPVIWHPGGAGGGGGYGAVFGIRHFSARPYPLYVEFGTGLYGSFNRLIYPRRAAYMTFYSQRYHRIIRTRHVRGQKKSKRFFYQSWREFQIYAAARILTADITH